VDWFIPAGSHINDGLGIQTDEFGGRPIGVGFYTGGRSNGELSVDYTTNQTQGALDALLSDAVASQYIRDCNDAW
jgi:hypothetical protein